VLGNIGFVVMLARPFTGRGMPLEDLVQEGMSGLLRAVDSYDPARGRLTTYARFWIERSIKRALINQPHTIRRPLHVSREVGALLTTARDLEARLGRKATAEELAAALHVPRRRVDSLRTLLCEPVALETRDQENDPAGPLAFVPDPKATDPLRAITQREKLEELTEALGRLGPREREVIERRFGTNGYATGWSLQEIGERLGVSRERARKIEYGALRKLRRILCPDLAKPAKRLAHAPQPS
jgi:RNA polymerase sigma factor (sigma-70 family)